MAVIAIMSLKGGVGKTTLATLIASTLAENEGKTLLLDLDPQESSRRWHQRRKDERLDVLAAQPSRATFVRVDQLLKDYEFIVIDLPPRLDSTNEFAFKFANIALCPVVPGQLDLDATGQTMNLLKKAGIPWRFVANRLRRTKFSSQLIGILGSNALKCGLRDRNAYVEWGAGVSLPRGPAMIEVEDLIDEIKTHIGIK